MKINYPLGELFCGAGGLALGAKSVKVIKNYGDAYSFSLAWANDIVQNACATYQENITPENKDKVICIPVQHLELKRLGDIEGLLFGFPCNDLSVVGEKKGFEGEYGPLYTYGVKVLNTHNPKLFLAENVSGLISANEGNALKIILNDLASAGLGYNITPHLYKSLLRQPYSNYFNNIVFKGVIL